MKEGLAQGISGELAAAGILLCSCVICRRQNYKQQDQNLYEEGTKPLNGVIFFTNTYRSANGKVTPANFYTDYTNNYYLYVENTFFRCNKHNSCKKQFTNRETYKRV